MSWVRATVWCKTNMTYSGNAVTSLGIGAHLDPLNLPSLPMVEQIITKTCPGFNGVAE